MEEQRVDNTNLDSEIVTRHLYQSWRENLARPLLIGVLILGLPAVIPAIIASNSILLDSIYISSYLVVALVTIIPFRFQFRIGAFLLAVFALGIGELITLNILGDSIFFFIALVIFAAMLVSPRAGIVAIAADSITLTIFGWLIITGQIVPINPNAAPATLDDWISGTASVIMFGIVIVLGFQRLERESLKAKQDIDKYVMALQDERTNLEQKVQERTRDLRKINEIGRAVNSILDPDNLLPRATEMIQNEFNSYFTAIYLVDTTGHWAVLHTATGEAGKVLSGNKHRVDLSGNSLIAQAIQTKQGLVNTNNSGERVRVENPLLPYTRSQVTLPLVAGTEVLGVLEMHSTKSSAFTPQDVDTYQNMANEIAIAIENSRLYQDAQQSLFEMRATQRQYLRDAWKTLTSTESLTYAVGDEEQNLDTNVEIPLSIREQTIGQIKLANTNEWNAEKQSLIEAIALQASQALENARLVEDSQATAAREHLANEIISKIWSSNNMDTILQTTVRELGRALEASEVEIEITTDNKDE